MSDYPPYGRETIPAGCVCRWADVSETNASGLLVSWHEMTSRSNACPIHCDEAYLARLNGQALR